MSTALTRRTFLKASAAAGGGLVLGFLVPGANRFAGAQEAALTMHAERGTIAVVDAGGFDTPSTKTAADGLAKFGEGRALIVLAREGEENAVKSFRNLHYVDVRPSDNVAVADIVRAKRLVVSESALERLTALAQPPTASSHTEREAKEASA